MAVYAASKAYVLSFTRALMGEYLHHPDIKVFLVSPSGTATDFQKTAGVRRDDTREKLLPPEQVAAKILEAISKDRREIIVGLSGNGMSLLARMLPAAIQVRIWRKLMSEKR
jgi:short-subunit dehydrogenase